MSGWEEFRKQLISKELYYPGNHHFDPETFEPLGLMASRIEMLKKHAPEMMNGGESFLDIGSNKGFLSFYLRNHYDEIVGYDPAKPYVEFAESLRKAHHISNISFRLGGMREIPFEKRYDTVYVGNCHYYMFADAVKYNTLPFLFLKKIAGLCKKTLIIDSEFSLTQYSSKKLSEEGQWSEGIRSLWNLEQHKKELAPQFKLIRFEENGAGRHIAIFSRIRPDMEVINGEGLKLLLKKKGKEIVGNSSRGLENMFLYEGRRYKWEKELLPDAVFACLNVLPQYFPHFYGIIVSAGIRVGEVAEWIDGEIVSERNRLLNNTLLLNNALTSIGLVELDLGSRDFKARGKDTIDVDVDLIRHINTLISQGISEQTMGKQLNNWGLSEVVTNEIVNHITDRDIFWKVLKERGYVAGSAP